jgi:sulfatase maturation enzyme AslB (radical SAM superfamily)
VRGTVTTRYAVEELEQVTLLLTERCNFDCIYCYRRGRDGRTMSERVAATAIGLLRASAQPAVELHFSGGEPLLEFDLLRRIVETAVHQLAGRTALTLSVSTNGSLLTPERIRYLAERGVRLQLSFDGVAAAQDRRCPGSFETLDEVLRQLRESEPQYFASSVTVAMTIDSRSAAFVADSAEYFLQRGVNGLRLSVTCTPDPGWTEATSTELMKQMQDTVPLAARLYEETGRVPFAWLRGGAAAAGWRRASRPLCAAARARHVAVDPSGQATTCEVFRAWQETRFPLAADAARLLHLGPIRGRSLHGRIARTRQFARGHPLFRGARHRRSASRACDRCEFQAECVVCPLAIVAEPGNRDPGRIPERHCAMTRATAAARREFDEQTRATALRWRVHDLRSELKRLATALSSGSGEGGGAGCAPAPPGSQEVSPEDLLEVGRQCRRGLRWR